MVTHKRLQGPFGVEITDFDPVRSMTPEALTDLVSLFYREQLIVIRDRTLSFEMFDHLTKQFGRQRPHFLDHLRMRGHPAILMLSNIFENGKQTGIYEGACFWHTDVAYEDPPNSATIVYALQVPKDRPAPTYVSDMFAAYDSLPERTKQRIDGLIALHHYGNRDDTVEGSPTAAERLTEDQKQRVSNVYHPLVMRHPVTGRRSLYGVAGSSFGIVGMPDDEATSLLGELARHATKPEFTTEVDYAIGDLAAWDTYSTLHKAPLVPKAASGDPHCRLLWRVSVTGVSPLVTPRAESAAAS